MGELNAETRKTITRANVQEVVVGGVGGSIISSLLFPFPLLTLPAKVEQFTVKRASGRTKKNEQKFNSRRSATTPTSPHLLHVPFTMRHMKQFIIYIFIAVVILHRRLLFTSSYSSCKTVELWKIYECNYPIWTSSAEEEWIFLVALSTIKWGKNEIKLPCCSKASATVCWQCAKSESWKHSELNINKKRKKPNCVAVSS